jgi:exodeoxyribonuclease-3
VFLLVKEVEERLADIRGCHVGCGGAQVDTNTASVQTCGPIQLMKLLSWNVNGLRSVLRKGFAEFVSRESPDFLCIQESRVLPEEADIAWALGYEAHWHSAVKKGYAGTATFSKTKPLSIQRGLGKSNPDDEGRVLSLEFSDFWLVNVYVPNSQRELTRLAYRQEWDTRFLRFLKKLEKSKPVVVCGDFNVAHTEIDLARPKQNTRTHGFTIEERNGFSAYVDAGFVDTFRVFEPSGGHYTWWSVMANARARNIGWRIDYFLISRALQPRLKRAWILPETTGSDHCPVGIELV